jgi:hypothetical protein
VAIRTSTLATFDVVNTVPETVSPEWTVVSLTATDNICGAASGGKRGIATRFGGDDATGTAVSTGVGLAVGEGCGVVAEARTFGLSVANGRPLAGGGAWGVSEAAVFCGAACPSDVV